MAITKLRSSSQLHIDDHLLLNGKLIQGLATPVDATDAATKGYVDSMAAGLDVKASVLCKSKSSSGWSTAGAGYNNGTLGVGAFFTIGTGADTLFDGALVNGTRVLIAEGNVFLNGIYTVSNYSSASGGSATFTRATDFDSPAKITSGAFTFVETGTLYADTGWVLKTDGAITVGTTPLEFTLFSKTADIEAGAGLTKSGNVINVVGTTNRITVAADSIDIANTYAGQTSITTLGTIVAGTWNGTTIAIANGGTGATTAPAARTNLGLGGAAVLNVGTTAGTVAAGDHNHSSVYQALDADLTAIAALAGTTGLLRKTAVNTWMLDTTDYVDLTSVQILENKELLTPTISNATLLGNTYLALGGVIIFEGSITDDFETTLTVANPTADRTITLPNVTGTIVTTGDTSTVTNAMLAGSIANAKLANSSISINGNAISLGGSITGLATTAGNLSQFAATTSLQLATLISDETGSGALVFGTSPTISNPKINTIVTTAAASNADLYTQTTGTITLGSTSASITTIGGDQVKIGTGSGNDIIIGEGAIAAMFGTSALNLGELVFNVGNITIDSDNTSINELLYLDGSKILRSTSFLGTTVTGKIGTWVTPDSYTVAQTASTINNLQVWLNGMLLTVTEDYTFGFAANVITVNIHDSFGATSADRVVMAYQYK